MRLTISPILALIVAAALLAAACGENTDDAATPTGGTQRSADDGERTGEQTDARIYAAASLSDVVRALAGAFESLRGGHVVPSFGASSALAEQLRNGAPPGVFVSASGEWVDKLEGWGLVEAGSRVDLASNALVLVVPKGAKERPTKLEDLADARFPRIALADPVAVPAGRYAKAALEKARIYEALQRKVVAAQDVRTALAYVESGEAPVGIVYATDAIASEKVEVAVRVPGELHPKILYPMVLVKGATRRARELHEFLKSEKAWPAFEKAGFTRP